jgi:hypothetical protein
MPTLTRAQVCNLLLVLASTVPLGSEPRGTQDHILFQFLRLPQPGGPGPRIYIPQEQGGPDISLDTGFSFRRLLRLAGLRWRYSNTPPHGILATSIVEMVTCERHYRLYILLLVVTNHSSPIMSYLLEPITVALTIHFGSMC